MTRVMNFLGLPRNPIAQGADCATAADRHALLIEFLMGGHAPAGNWIETMLDRIEARP